MKFSKFIGSSVNLEKLVAFLIVILLLSAFSCQTQTSVQMLKDHESLQQKIDDAILKEDPMKEVQELLPQIQKYDIVDSAWIDGYSFWIQYKNGGKQMWLIPLPNKNLN